MPRGGKRAGAGRKKTILTADREGRKPRMIYCDSVELELVKKTLAQFRSEAAHRQKVLQEIENQGQEKLFK